MAPDAQAPQLSAQVRSGESHELRLLAAQGLLPVPLPELVGLQVFLAGLDQPDVAPVAAASLRGLDARVAVGVLDEVEPEVVVYLALNHPHPSVVEKALQVREVPHELLCQVAPKLSDELQEILLLRQDAIVECPEILDALEQNPELSAYARRRVAEYRQHLLPGTRPRKAAAGEAPGAEAAPSGPVIDVAQLTEELGEEAVQELPSEVFEGGAGLSEIQIRALPTAVRMQLSRGAPRNLRAILIHDTNPAVALSTLTNNAIPEDELEQVATSRSVLEDVLLAIGRNAKWMRKYKIVKALICNPRTPAGLAVRMVPRLSVRDLRTISRDRNVTDAVRSTALRLYRIKLK